VNDIDKITAEVSERGWSVTELFREDRSRFLSLANSLGVPIPSRRSGAIVDTLAPIKPHLAPPRSMSALHGEGAFPFHTDAAYLTLPPKYVLLRIVSNAECSRDTLLIDMNELGLPASLRRRLCNEVWLVNGGRGRFYSPIINCDVIQGNAIVRYDLNCMRAITEQAEESGRSFNGFLMNAPYKAYSWIHDQVLVIDNWRMLHARGPKPARSENDRILERILISPPHLS
jgi:alpha-ketoglutarate-dependent taurine dioxygenase